MTEAALAAFTTTAGHRRKERRPPSVAARAEADRLRRPGTNTEDPTAARNEGRVIDLARYAAAANGRNTLTPPTRATQPDTTKETNHQ